MRTLFITGTDTGVGKTVAACALIRYLVSQGESVAGLKPVASGCEETPDGLRNEDALKLMAAANVDLDYAAVNPYAFVPPIAPHLAAHQAGVSINIETAAAVTGNINADWLIVEGVGGWCVPLDDEQMLCDLARVYTREVVLVVGLRLGCINHAMLSIEQIRRDGFKLLGWIANSLDNEMSFQQENLETLVSRIKAPMICHLPWNKDENFSENVSWNDSFRS